jgi:hypothetical protein
MTALKEWESFYVIVGSSAGALIGLQFVVMTLIADAPGLRADPQAGAAFGSPSVVHFGVVLFLSAIISAPWPSITVAAILCGGFGVCGTIYTVIVIRRLRGQTAYQPVFEDWLFHALLPFAAYAGLVASACVVHWHVQPGLFLVAAAVLLLLFVGIHNAWDAVTYHVFEQRRREEDTR